MSEGFLGGWGWRSREEGREASYMDDEGASMRGWVLGWRVHARSSLFLSSLLYIPLE